MASGRSDDQRRGDVQVTTWDLERGTRTTLELADHLELDDHNAPALHRRSDGRWLAVYTRHGTDRRVRSRVSERPGDATAWRPEQPFEVAAARGVTYSNLHRVRDQEGRGVLLNLFRGEGWDPNVLVSPDGGATWAWSALTRHSTLDHLRPIVPRWEQTRTALLWLRGTLRSYTDYDLEVVGLILDQAWFVELH